MADDSVTILHNPACGTSRNTLSLIRGAGIEPVVVEYLKTPPTKSELRELIDAMGVPVREVVREKGTPFKELGLDAPGVTDDDLLDAMIAHPILINRPIVSTAQGVKLCRPSELVLDLLPPGSVPDLAKEEGAPFLVDKQVPSSKEMTDALQAEGLPTDDLEDADRTFFQYDTLGGSQVGYGGFERYGSDVLLRSMVVLPEMRGQGIGRNMTLLLMRRAFDQGARTAYVLTTSARPFFEAQGFKAINREEAPASILATRQASSLCPSSATLLARRITF
ncbi:arsenic resistance N-acetyltransferase ArsN2 [Microvirga sp. Mcv34]|uniref:arsenic resistance N-acetyltransferase ArsN2 n=1 Tax=Microvirga sp. Mcv34 TaxID=2926016 RepID=UPI0021C9461E|nr:arsenic resistance N-acetyltransferase ArsN2 [Microvirga sp. Mcv34]